MARRTGDKVLDEKIERFIEWGLRESCLRHCIEGGSGMCDDMTAAFQRQLRDRLPDGYRFEWVALLDDRLWNMGNFPEAHTFEVYGYDDRGFGQPQHHMTEITTPDGDTFTVDFAAVQYGYLDFPLVQRRAPDGSWQREPDGVEWTAPQPPQLSDLTVGSRLPRREPARKRPLLARVLGV